MRRYKVRKEFDKVFGIPEFYIYKRVWLIFWRKCPLGYLSPEAAWKDVEALRRWNR